MPTPGGVERARLIDAILGAAGSCVAAAKALGVSRATLYRRLDAHGLDPESLRVIGGRYELVARLGQGGQARVFEVNDRMSGHERCALKLIGPMADQAALPAIQGEFRLLSLLSHRGLPRVRDFEVDKAVGTAYLAMDLVEGKPFLEALKGRRIVEIAAAMAELLDVLSHLHRAGVVHRDISSANVLVEISETIGIRPAVFLVDLGLAQSMTAGKQPAAGKINYLAPELIQGSPASARTDLYAVGVLGYLALAGRLPWPDSLLADDTGDSEPLKLSQVLPEIDRGLEQILSKLVRRDPGQRCDDAASARDELLNCALLRRAAWFKARSVESPLVGRQSELDTLEHWRTAADSTPGIAVLADVGVGKSRLLRAAAGSALSAGSRVLWLSWRGAVGSGLSQLGQGLNAFATGLPDQEPAREAILQLARQLSAQDLSSTTLVDLESGADALASACGSRGLLLICDDLHDAEAALLDLLSSWLRRWRQTPVRLLMASRTPVRGVALDVMLRSAEVEGNARALLLPALDQRASQQLIASQSDSARAALWAQRLFELTGGNPLFLELVLEETVESEIGAEHGRMPSSIDAAARELVARLSGPARLWSEVVSVAEGACSQEEVLHLSGVAATEEELAVSSTVLTCKDGRIDFRHPFLRRVQREQLTSQQRQAWHATWVEHCRGDETRLQEHALHLVGAKAGPSAVPVWIEAATQLEHRWEHRRAIPLLEACIEALADDDPVRLTLLARLERACHRVRDEQRSLQVCQQWAAAARAMGDLAAEAKAIAMAAVRHRERGELNQARALARQADSLAAKSGSREVQSLTAKILGSVLWMGWEHKQALQQFERVLEYVDERDDPRAAALSYHDAAFVLHIEGQRQRAFDLLDRAKTLFRTAGDDAWELAVDNNLAFLMASTGDIEAADHVLSEVIARFATMTHGLPVEAFLESRAYLLWRLGKYEALLDVCDALITEATRFSRSEPRIVGLLFRAEALREMDDRASARRHVRLAVELAEALAAPRQMAFARLAKARDLREDGQVAAAEELATAIYASAITIPRLRVAALAAIEQAECALARAAPREALAFLEQAESALVVPREDGSWRRVQLLRVRAHARFADGQRTPAFADLEEGLGLARIQGCAADHLSLLRLASRAYADAGDSSRAAAALAEGAETLGRLASTIANPTLHAQFLGRPDHAATLAAAQRMSGSSDQSTSRRAASNSIRGLIDVGRRAAAGEAIEPLLSRIVALAVESSGMERGALVLRSKENDELRVAAAIGLENETTADALRLSQHVLDRVKGGRAVVVRDARLDPELVDAPSVVLLGIRSVVCLPLRVGEEVHGAIYLDTRSTEAVWGDQDLGFLDALAAQATLAIEYAQLVEKIRAECDLWRSAALPLDGLGEMLGGSAAMAGVFALIKKVAPSHLSVVICGESGTGKELAAKAIHALSSRADRPFVAENVATLHESLAESSLFGHVRGAFTGAHESRRGLFAQADGGTLFLDEIADLQPSLQAKLLRVLQEGEFTPLGAAESVRVDVRVVVATQRDLGELVAEGRFRGDLFYRLNGVTLNLPPLRDRPEEIPRLIRHFLQIHGGSNPPEFAPEVISRLVAFSWPGNVRELENTVHRLILLADSGRVDSFVLALDPLFASVARRAAWQELRLGSDEERAKQIRNVLEICKGDRSAAARMLNVARATFYRWLKKLGIDPDDLQHDDPSSPA